MLVSSRLASRCNATEGAVALAECGTSPSPCSSSLQPVPVCGGRPGILGGGAGGRSASRADGEDEAEVKVEVVWAPRAPWLSRASRRAWAWVGPGSWACCLPHGLIRWVRKRPARRPSSRPTCVGRNVRASLLCQQPEPETGHLSRGRCEWAKRRGGEAFRRRRPSGPAADSLSAEGSGRAADGAADGAAGRREAPDWRCVQVRGDAARAGAASTGARPGSLSRTPGGSTSMKAKCSPSWA